MKQTKITLMLLIIFSIGFSKTLSLEECFQLAEKNHPLMKQKTPINEITKNQLSNINTKWLPELNLNLLANYQSDVTKIEIDLPAVMAGTFDMPSPDKDSYKSEIELNQLLYDGGLISVQKELARQDNKISIQQLETNFQSIKSSIAMVYYNLLLLDKQKTILQTWLNDLEKNKKTLSNLIENGITEKSSIYEIKIKIHELNQQIDENRIYYENNLRSLSELVGTEVNNKVKIYIPKNIEENDEIVTAQSILFNYQVERLSIAKKVTFRNHLPKIFSFGKFGYGKPGMNMLSNDFDFYYLVGVGLQWNIWDWKFNKHEREKIQFSQKIIEFSEEVYNQKTRIELGKYQSSIVNLNQKLAKDEKIFTLHKKLKSAAESKFKNGVMNTTDYLKYDNNYVRAELSMELHKIQLYREKVNYQILKGEL